MTRKPRPQSKQDDPKQSKLFIAKAHELGADDDGMTADGLLGQLAKLPPDPKHKTQK